jgi:hypothetical protein
MPIHGALCCVSGDYRVSRKSLRAPIGESGDPPDEKRIKLLGVRTSGQVLRGNTNCGQIKFLMMGSPAEQPVLDQLGG